MTKNVSKFLVLAVALLIFVWAAQAQAAGRNYVNVLGQVLGIKIAETNCGPAPTCAYGTNYDQNTGCAIGCLNPPSNSSGSTPASDQDCVVNGVVMQGPCSNYPPQQQPPQQQLQQPQDSATFHCYSLGRQAAAAECDAADKAKMNQYNQQTATCNIPELGGPQPGACSEWYQDNNGKWVRGGGQYQNQNMRQDQKMNQEGEWQAREEQMNKQRAEEMRRGMQGFLKNATSMERNMNSMKNRLKGCPFGIPAELTAALAEVKALGQKLNSVSGDELEDLIYSIQDQASLLGERGPQMGRIPQLCEMYKRAGKEITTLEKDIKRITKNNKIDTSGLVAEINTAVSGLKGTLEKVKTLAVAGEYDEANDLFADFYDQINDIRADIQAANAAANIARELPKIKKEIANYKKQLAALAKKKKNITEASALLAEAESLIPTIEGMLKTKLSPDFMDYMETLYGLRGDFMMVFTELTGGSSMPQIKEEKSYNVNMQLPDFFNQPNESQVRTMAPGTF